MSDTTATKGPSDEAVRDATGRDYGEWFALLDQVGAVDLDHKALVAAIAEHAPDVSGWWHQTVAVEYERARGKRVLGQTADGLFQLGVTRTFDVAPEQLWELIVSRPQLWLGEGAEVAFEVGERYKLEGADAASGEIRVVKPGDRLRMTWQPQGWPAPATLQLAMTARGPGKTSLTAHLEKLPDAEAREALRERWRAVMDRLAAALP